MQRRVQGHLMIKANKVLLFFSATILLSSHGVAHEDTVQGKHYVLDSHVLPLGDGKGSASSRRGYVYSCTTSFRGGGAQHDGNWINGTTWDQSKKYQFKVMSLGLRLLLQ